MTSTFTKAERDAIFFHLAFSLFSVIILAVPGQFPGGQRLLLLTLLYNLGLPLAARQLGHREWLLPWLFSFCVSLFQVFPDWFLSAALDILAFPEDGLFKIGTVSGYMPLLWTIPMFLVIYSAERIKNRKGNAASYLTAALAALIIFGGSEQTMWILGSWYPKNVTLVSHTAIYILIPEMILGLFGYFMYRVVEGKNRWSFIPAAFAVMLLYLGAACFFYLMIEKVILA